MRVVCGMELNEMQSGITRSSPANRIYSYMSLGSSCALVSD